MSVMIANLSNSMMVAGAPKPAAAMPVLAAVRASSPKRFTVDGSETLEQHLGAVCEQVLTHLQDQVPPSKIEAVLLGGGYGCGEGGVLKTEAEDHPYHGLEFFVALEGNEWLSQRRYARGLRAMAQKLSVATGVEMEITLISLPRLRRSPIGMSSYELVTGHRWLVGEESLLAGCDHHREAGRIPLAEATRLLLNRCSGLLFASERLGLDIFLHEDADFVGRNLAKAQLALGDAVLTVLGKYHWSSRERHRRLQALATKETLSWLPEVVSHHAAGVAFKLHPRQTRLPRITLQLQFDQLAELSLRVWLWLESRRLGHPFASAREYALSSVPKCPDAHSWRNCLSNVRTFGPAVLGSRRLADHPRERLFHALTLLLWKPSVMMDSELLERVQHELRTRACKMTELIGAYQLCWQHCN